MTEMPEKSDVWERIAAPLPAGSISWRQDGRPIARDGKYSARFVAYIDAQTVRERLDLTVPGEWDLTLELLPPMPQDDDSDEARCSFKARLAILGVIREDVGNGRDYKQAATDAFKRAAVRFGVAHELYSMEQCWVQVDGDGKFAKPLEDPGAAYARRMARNGAKVNGAAQASPSGDGGSPRTAAPAPAPSPAPAVESPLATAEPSCPKCGGRMWDNRMSKKSPKAPDYKCRSRSCDGVIWPPRGDAGSGASVPAPAPRPAAPHADAPPLDESCNPENDTDLLPF